MPDAVIVENGDAVAGKGIYRNQHMDSVVQSSADQIKVAAYDLTLIDREIKSAHPNATVSWKITRGNHDMDCGEPLAPALTMTLRTLGVDATYCGDKVIFNAASGGTYNIYAEHGYGYSKISLHQHRERFNDSLDMKLSGPSLFARFRF